MNESPAWVDRTEYPFRSRFLEIDGRRMHYIDEGQGPILLFVHGTPDWSFGYRKVIRSLSAEYRCIALDHLGFGLSDKPQEVVYTPAFQAANFQSFIAELGLTDITLILHDFGGPIGLAYAESCPQNIRALVLMNTWFWPLKGDPHFESFDRLLGNRLGRYLYLNLGFSARIIMKSVFADKSHLPPAIHQQYLKALPDPEARKGTWDYARSLLGASDWFAELWEHRDRLRGVPVRLLWGMKDTAFRPKELDRLTTAFPSAEVTALADCGHFVQEERPDAVAAAIRDIVPAAHRAAR